jgi:methylated-DNA-[protein]-cysteine S-methyltransferase
MIYTCKLETPLGVMTAWAGNGALTGLWFISQKYYPERSPGGIEGPDYPLFKDLRIWLNDYFRGINRIPEIRLEPQGTAFQITVWNILLKIPFGQLTTYGAIAREIVRSRGLASMSAQAVGGAVGHNPISILIPCHRVIASNGSLTGYAGGLDKKRALLQLEGMDPGS